GLLGSYDRIFHDHGEDFGDWYATQDQMIFAGNLAVTQSGSSETEYYWEIYHLMGDPSLMVYFGVPPVLNATYIPIIPLGSTTFTVNTEPYAYVAVSMENILYGAAIADNLGVANITITPFETPGTANVVATKQNRSPFISTVVVANPTGPYVVFNSKQLHDALGNDEEKADFGENYTLDISLQNVGSDTANSVSATLSTTDTYVTITDNTENWGDINNGAISSQNNVYAFTVNDSVPDQHIAAFTLTITDNNSNTWVGTFNITLNAPVLTIGNFTINDASGNNNGRLDPGETADIIISCSNTGHADAANTISAISSLDSYITINSASADLGTLISGGGTASASFNITVNSSAVIGSFATFNNMLISGTYSAQKSIHTIIGIVEEDWETNNFTKYPWVLGGAAVWTITNVNPFDGIYSAKSGKIPDSETSELSISLNVLIDDSISFYKKVSSEEDFDFLKFYIDGNLQREWSGQNAWSRSVFPVTAGIHTVKWTYEKDESTIGGDDLAWIDNIIFPAVQFISSVDESTSPISSFEIYPIPIDNNTVFSYTINDDSPVSIIIFNSLGQEVKSIVNRNQPKGIYTITTDLSKLRTGIYFCKLTTKSAGIIKKIIVK
ncbi:MAG: T9SS type A sorting domain-containing protein, partial [Bacteroidetes bacterium]|nr:T9SS type A sorting domain-containing protein [Bacteroidota bacterium]